MTEKEKSDYLLNKLILEVEEKLFEDWYQLQFDKTSLRKIRQGAFRKEIERRRSRINELIVPCKLFETLERMEEDFREEDSWEEDSWEEG